MMHYFSSHRQWRRRRLILSLYVFYGVVFLFISLSSIVDCAVATADASDNNKEVIENDNNYNNIDHHPNDYDRRNEVCTVSSDNECQDINSIVDDNDEKASSAAESSLSSTSAVQQQQRVVDHVSTMTANNINNNPVPDDDDIVRTNGIVDDNSNNNDNDDGNDEEDMDNKSLLVEEKEDEDEKMIFPGNDENCDIGNDSNGKNDNDDSYYSRTFHSLNEFQDMMDQTTKQLSLDQISFWVVLLLEYDDNNTNINNTFCSSIEYNRIMNESFDQIIVKMNQLRTLKQQRQQGDSNGDDKKQQPTKEQPFHPSISFAKIIFDSNQSKTVSMNDKKVLHNDYNIQNIPTIVFIAASGQQGKQQVLLPPIVEEYHGITYRNMDILLDSIIHRYYYHTYLTTSTAIISTESKNDSTNADAKTMDEETDADNEEKIVIDRIQTEPTYFSSISKVQEFFVKHSLFLFRKEGINNFQNTARQRQGLSLSLPVVERLYIEYIMGWTNYNHKIDSNPSDSTNNNDTTSVGNNNNDNTNKMDDDGILLEQQQLTPGSTSSNNNITVMIQYRCVPSIGSNNSNWDGSESSSRSIQENVYDNSRIDYETIYGTFNTMSQILSHRRDLLFLIVTDCTDESADTATTYENGSVHIFQIPSTAPNDWVTQDADSTANNNHCWLQKYQCLGAQFVPSHYLQKYDSRDSINSINPDDIVKNATTEEYEQKLKASNTLIAHTRLHEFLIKVTSPTTMWLDREMTAPIAFANGRHVHAVLFINMHHTVLNDLLIQEEKSYESYDDEDAKNLIITIFENDKNITEKMKRAALHFQSVCQQHRMDNFFSSDSSNDSSKVLSNVVSRDMVCMVVPSTETRILNAFGIDYWSPLDAAASQSDDEQPEKTEIFPMLLITDQRSNVATKRYYLDLSSSHDESAADDMERNSDIRQPPLSRLETFLSDFWGNKLSPEVKSDTKGARTNKSGVRIVTGDVAAYELFRDDDEATDKKNVIKLLLLIAPTCGHCKRISAMWNEFAKFVQHIEWDSVIKLYRVDVTSNDVEVSLNLTSQWVPEVYYVIPTSANVNKHKNGKIQHTTRRFIRYSHLSAESGDSVMNGGDDGVGSIHEFTDILEWLILDIFEKSSGFDENSITGLYSDLIDKFS